jgi:hypothetical protein
VFHHCQERARWVWPTPVERRPYLQLVQLVTRNGTYYRITGITAQNMKAMMSAELMSRDAFLRIRYLLGRVCAHATIVAGVLTVSLFRAE